MEREQPQLGDLLTMVINHLLNGMILQAINAVITPVSRVFLPQTNPFIRVIYRVYNSTYKLVGSDPPRKNTWHSEIHRGNVHQRIEASFTKLLFQVVLTVPKKTQWGDHFLGGVMFLHLENNPHRIDLQVGILWKYSPDWDWVNAYKDVICSRKHRSSSFFMIASRESQGFAVLRGAAGVKAAWVLGRAPNFFWWMVYNGKPY